jgi:hypothetical protein
LSVPHLGRGEKSVIEVLKEIYRGRFFYQIYLQEPGVAERAFEADPGANPQGVLCCFRRCVAGRLRPDRRQRPGREAAGFGVRSTAIAARIAITR